MTKPEIKVEGARELKAALRKIEGGIADLKEAHADAAHIVEVRAVELVPYVSGNLAGSIRSSGTQAGGVVRSGAARVPYAGVIHFGWAARNIRPQPFLYDALDDRTDEVIETYEKQINKLIKANGLD